MSIVISESLRHLKNRLGIRAALIQLIRSHSTESKSILTKITPHNEPTHQQTHNEPPHKIHTYAKNTNILSQHVESIQCYEGQHGKTDWPATFLVLDLETTGLNRDMERIVEAAIRDIKGGPKSTFLSLVNPEREITNSHIHGISTSMVSQHGVPTFGELVPDLLEFVKSRQIPGKPVVLIAHHGRSFDFPFLENEFHRCGFELPDFLRFLDSLTLARLCIKGPKGLGDLKEYYEIPSQGPAHRAMTDVNVLCDVLKRLTFQLKMTPLDLLKYSITTSQINSKKKKEAQLI